jgi:arylformamidase
MFYGSCNEKYKSSLRVMEITLHHSEQTYIARLDQPLDISIALRSGKDNPNCFYAPMPLFEPVRAGGFVGNTQEGGTVNFYNVHINPHGNGTHTECVGHIARETYTINQCLQKFHSIGYLATVTPVKAGTDQIISAELLSAAPIPPNCETLVLRTLPNGIDKTTRSYSGANPPYIHPDAMGWIVERGIKHLIVDIPSVDREEDGGALAAHKIFWNYPQQPRTDATITELAYMNDAIEDGLYLVNIHIMSIELDASPSKVTLYNLKPVSDSV